jgi:hypothetical protein
VSAETAALLVVAASLSAGVRRKLHTATAAA